MKLENSIRRGLRHALVGAMAVVPFVALAASTAQAHQMIALDEVGNLLRFSDTSPRVTERVNVTGTSARLVGIDVRPADGMLYGVTSDGGIYRIDSGSGRVTSISRMNVGNLGAISMADFNPVADRLRIVTADGRSFRVNVDNGETIEDSRLNYVASRSLMVAAGGYTNSLKGATSTQLYQIDTTNLVLTLQDPPNAGTLTTVNAIALTGGTKDIKGGDVVTNSRGVSEAFVARGSRLYRIEIPSGQISLLGQIGAEENLDVVDIAIVTVE